MTIVAVAGALLLFLTIRSDEPKHDGHRLTYWLERLWHSDDKVRLEAEEAIRSMGTNAVPYLIRMLPERETEWMQKYNYRVQQLFGNDAYRARWFFVGGRSHLAAYGLRAIGPNAKEAVPFLIQNMTNYPATAGAASEYQYALVFIGADSILPLTAALSHPDSSLRAFAWGTLGLCDPTNLVLAVPALIGLLNMPDADTRAESTRLLGFASGDFHAVSALVGCLTNADETVRKCAAQGLYYQGQAAKSALPALEYRGDQQRRIDSAATGGAPGQSPHNRNAAEGRSVDDADETD